MQLMQIEVPYCTKIVPKESEEISAFWNSPDFRNLDFLGTRMSWHGFFNCYLLLRHCRLVIKWRKILRVLASWHLSTSKIAKNAKIEKNRNFERKYVAMPTLWHGKNYLNSITILGTTHFSIKTHVSVLASCKNPIFKCRFFAKSHFSRTIFTRCQNLDMDFFMETSQKICNLVRNSEKPMSMYCHQGIFRFIDVENHDFENSAKKADANFSQNSWNFSKRFGGFILVIKWTNISKNQKIWWPHVSHLPDP